MPEARMTILRIGQTHTDHFLLTISDTAFCGASASKWNKACRARALSGVLENKHIPTQKILRITLFTIVDLSFQQALAFLVST